MYGLTALKAGLALDVIEQNIIERAELRKKMQNMSDEQLKREFYIASILSLGYTKPKDLEEFSDFCKEET